MIIGVLALTLAGCSARAQTQPLPARICDQNGCRDRTATEQPFGERFDFHAFMNKAEQARTIDERETEEQSVDDELQRLEQERNERFRLEARAEENVSEVRLRRREERDAERSVAPLRCRRTVRTLLAPLRGSLTCGDAGVVTSGLLDGDCPIAACIMRVRDDANPFGGPLDF